MMSCIARAMAEAEMAEGGALARAGRGNEEEHLLYAISLSRVDSIWLLFSYY